MEGRLHQWVGMGQVKTSPLLSTEDVFKHCVCILFLTCFVPKMQLPLLLGLAEQKKRLEPIGIGASLGVLSIR
jgi:hypothetical protein